MIIPLRLLPLVPQLCLIMHFTPSMTLFDVRGWVIVGTFNHSGTEIST